MIRMESKYRIVLTKLSKIGNQIRNFSHQQRLQIVMRALENFSSQDTEKHIVSCMDSPFNVVTDPFRSSNLAFRIRLWKQSPQLLRPARQLQFCSCWAPRKG
eukprot:TRINITY_DN2434_c0_g1_i1.p1 TRINITY_DN2434_c0_g1~~TRINITY_DN2434_c0_g1_i1.p1  ORF type:complete len:102 (-),score=18.07 TRINITY_DN2434_c0_g1_i1:208-513(-)